MDAIKTGALIRRLRREQGLTQKQLAERLHVSDKAVSKWERGCGCPDLSLLTNLSAALGIALDGLLCGDLSENDISGGNMKKLNFYVCPQCGNILTAAAEASIACCGKKLTPLTMQKAEQSQRLQVEQVENEYFVTSDHEMTKEHFISFVVLLTSDTLVLRRQYPEWDLQTRLPRLGGGLLVWHCSQHGLFYQPLMPAKKQG